MLTASRRDPVLSVRIGGGARRADRPSGGPRRAAQFGPLRHKGADAVFEAPRRDRPTILFSRRRATGRPRKNAPSCSDLREAGGAGSCCSPARVPPWLPAAELAPKYPPSAQRWSF